MRGAPNFQPRERAGTRPPGRPAAMSGAEEAGGGGPAAGPAGAVPAGAGAGVGAGAGASAGPAAALGEAAGPGVPDEAGLAGARQLQEAAGDPDAPPKKRLRAAETAEAAAAAAAGSGKLEERLYSVLCCTVCLDLPKASVYQVGPPARPGSAPAPPRPVPRHRVSSEARSEPWGPEVGPWGPEVGLWRLFGSSSFSSSGNFPVSCCEPPFFSRCDCPYFLMGISCLPLGRPFSFQVPLLPLSQHSSAHPQADPRESWRQMPVLLPTSEPAPRSPELPGLRESLVFALPQVFLFSSFADTPPQTCSPAHPVSLYPLVWKNPLPLSLLFGKKVEKGGAHLFASPTPSPHSWSG